MTNRYQVIETGFGDAMVVDTSTSEYVRTNSGRIYEAPFQAAQWTANMLNRKTTPEPKPETETDTTVKTLHAAYTRLAEQDPTPKDFDQAQAELTRQAVTLESRLESSESVLARLEPMGTDTEAARRKADSALMWRMSAYKGGVSSAEKKVREALTALPDTTGNIRARVKLETALSALEVAREVAEDENPYA